MREPDTMKNPIKGPTEDDLKYPEAPYLCHYTYTKLLAEKVPAFCSFIAHI